VSVAVIADAHLGGPGGDAAPLVAQLDELPARGAERLVLLGDLFQGWVGFRRFETAEVRAVTAALRRLRAAGLRVDYVEGNRDFFLAGGPYADAFDSIGREVAFTAGGERFLAVHGDGLDARDWKYRFWRRASKSWLSRLVVGRTPRRLAARLVESTERSLSRTNAEHKRHIPEQVLRDYGRRRLAEGYRAILLGHFHEAHRWPVDGGEVRLLEAWYTSRRVEWLPEGAPRPPHEAGGEAMR
jgi:UDP-2,3-diacylglucosamine hydrolase